MQLWLCVLVHSKIGFVLPKQQILHASPKPPHKTVRLLLFRWKMQSRLGCFAVVSDRIASPPICLCPVNSFAVRLGGREGVGHVANIKHQFAAMADKHVISLHKSLTSCSSLHALKLGDENNRLNASARWLVRRCTNVIQRQSDTPKTLFTK